MNVKGVQNPSFKAYVPVTYYAKNPADGKYCRVMKPENVKKCQSFVVRNLNGTAKNMKNQQFVDFYSQFDSDYRNRPEVRSVYDNDSARVFVITGNDVDAVTQFAKPIGKAKGESIDRTGHSSSFETKLATNDYFRQIKYFLRNSCRQIKDSDGNKLTLRVFFDPKYKKDGTLKGFEFVNARMISDGEH